VGEKGLEGGWNGMEGKESGNRKAGDKLYVWYAWETFSFIAWFV